MQGQNEQAVPQVKKRFCCGAAKRLKEKCLRFHQDESKCIDFIQGHQECVAHKRIFEGREPLPSLPLAPSSLPL